MRFNQDKIDEVMRLLKQARKLLAIGVVVELGRDGEYSDMNSPHLLPIAALVQELEAAGHHDLAERTRNGDFDHER